MSKEQAEAQIKAAAWSAAAALGWREAIAMLNQAVSDIQAAQWAGPANR